MGKRKTKPFRPPAKPRPKPLVQFNCPFCNSASSVSCTMDKDNKWATVKCCVCNADYTVKWHELMDPVDVYSEWIDACEEANEGVA